MLNDFLFRLRAVFRRRGLEQDLDAELRFHLAEQVEAFVRQGFAPAEARRRARLLFGGLEQVKDDCRDARGIRLAEQVVRDVRHALRLLARSPGFTAVAIGSLAIGIGANASIFAAADAFLFRPAPFRDAGRLVALADRTEVHTGWPISYPDFLDWKARNRVFDEMAAYRNTRHVLSDRSGAELVRALDVSSGFLQVVGVTPILGRDFLPAEHVRGGDAVALVSEELWQRRFDADPAILGTALSLDGRPFTIVGILAAGFNAGARGDVFTSIEQWGREGRGSHNSLYGIARLKTNVTVEQARAEMDAVAAALEREYPGTNRNRRVDILPFGHVRMGETRTPLLMLMAAVGFVLLIACANFSNLLLSRSAARAREVAIRRAIGASRGRLVAQMLTESLLVAVLGGALGLLIGEWGCRALVRLSGDLARFPGGEAITRLHVDLRVVAFTIVATLAAGFASGLWPALHASGGDLTPPLKAGWRAGGGGRDARRVRSTFVVVQVGLALVLLAGAGLLTRSLHALLTGDRGFEARHVLTFGLTRPAIPASLAMADRVALARRFASSTRLVLDEIAALPGVEAAAVAFPLPFGRGTSGDCVHVEGRPVPPPKACAEAIVRQVSPGYFAALGLRLRAGRWVTEADAELGAAVNETMARAWWRGEAAVGRRFRMGRTPRYSPWYTVLGVVADTRENGLDRERVPEIYVRSYGGSDVLVRTAGDPLALVPVIRARVREVEKERAPFDIQPLESLIAESVRGRRILASLLGAFAAAALLLAGIGVYGVVAYAVARRTQEIGVRIALGASRVHVMALVLTQGLAPVAIGIGLGSLGVYWAAGVLRGWLFGISPTDPLTFAGVALLLALVALAACLLPARRAVRVDPVVALRCE
jgi:putative ABC transport system permease protein